MTDSQIIIVVGRRRTGKTTTVKKWISKVHHDALLIHDVSAQFTDIYSKPKLTFDQFTEKSTKVSDAVIVYDDASAFINHAKNQDITEFISTSRFKNNTAFFCFHSLRLVPFHVYDLADVVILHKTKDKEDLVRDRFDDDDFTECFRRVNKHPDFHYSEIYRL